MPNVRLRPPIESDLEAWVQSINDPDIMRGMDRAKVASLEHHRDYVRRFTEDGTAAWFVIEADGTFAGMVWLWDIHERHRRAEVRIFVSATHSGRGVARAALEVLQRTAYDELALHKLYAYVHEANAASRKAFEAAGFTIEAVLRRDAIQCGNYTDVFRLCSFSSHE